MFLLFYLGYENSFPYDIHDSFFNALRPFTLPATKKQKK